LPPLASQLTLSGAAVEEGLRFQLKGPASDEWRDALSELSGGQKSLLASAFLFGTRHLSNSFHPALPYFLSSFLLFIFLWLSSILFLMTARKGVAHYQRKNLYILDEVDAALDEINSQKLAQLCNICFSNSQARFVSLSLSLFRTAARVSSDHELQVLAVSHHPTFQEEVEIHMSS
jgi:hypothetical protein